MDMFPDVAIDCLPSESQMPYCQQDNCVNIYNPIQDQNPCEIQVTPPSEFFVVVFVVVFVFCFAITGNYERLQLKLMSFVVCQITNETIHPLH